MDPKSMTRKDFITLTFTLIGSAVAASACCADNTNNTGIGGTYGTGGNHRTRRRRRHRRPRRHHGRRRDHRGRRGTTGAGGTGTSACTDPLPETQVAGHDGAHAFGDRVCVDVELRPARRSFTTSIAVGHSRHW